MTIKKQANVNNIHFNKDRMHPFKVKENENERVAEEEEKTTKGIKYK